MRSEHHIRRQLQIESRGTAVNEASAVDDWVSDGHDDGPENEEYKYINRDGAFTGRGGVAGVALAQMAHIKLTYATPPRIQSTTNRLSSEYSPIRSDILSKNHWSGSNEQPHSKQEMYLSPSRSANEVNAREQQNSQFLMIDVSDTGHQSPLDSVLKPMLPHNVQTHVHAHPPRAMPTMQFNSNPAQVYSDDDFDPYFDDPQSRNLPSTMIQSIFQAPLQPPKIYIQSAVRSSSGSWRKFERGEHDISPMSDKSRDQGIHSSSASANLTRNSIAVRCSGGPI